MQRASAGAHCSPWALAAMSRLRGRVRDQAKPIFSSSDDDGEGLEACGKPAAAASKRQGDEFTPSTRQPAAKPRVDSDAMPAWAEGMMGTLTGKLDSISTQVTDLNDAMLRLTERVNSIEKRVAKVEEDDEKTNSTLARHQGDISDIKKRVKDMEKALNGLKAEVGEAAVGKKDLKMVRDVREAMIDLKKAMPLAGTDFAPMAEHRKLQSQLDELRSMAAALNSHAGEGGHAPAAPNPHAMVGEALARELREHGLLVKLEGVVERKEGQSEIHLCMAARDALSRKVGGGAQIDVRSALWLKPQGPQQKPRLLLKLGSEAMVRAVLGLKGKPGAPSKLAAGERILSEFGPVEMAVRQALYEEVGSHMGEGRAWVGRSCIFVDGKPQPLSDKAVTAGMQALSRPRARPTRRTA